MSQKQKYAQAVIANSSLLLQFYKNAQEIMQLWNDRQYGIGGANAFSDSDLAQFEISADQFNRFVQIWLPTFLTLMTSGNGELYANQIRNDI